MGTDSDITRVAPAKAQRIAADLLRAYGVSAKDADTIASQLVLADLRGVDTHGLIRLPGYIGRVEAGDLHPDRSPTVMHETPGTAMVDGHHNFGQVVADFAMQVAIEKAQTVGVGTVTAKNSSHFGAAATFAMMAADAGCMGISATNGWPLMPGVGGAERTIGNNPLAIAGPTRLGYPMVLDIAMSQVAAGKLRIALALGQKIPLDWAFDNKGEPTDDPHEALFNNGLLRPVGDHKGFGLAVMMDVLSGVLSGGMYGTDVTSDQPGYSNVGHFFTAINIDAFGGLELFLDRIDDLAHRIQASKTRDGADPVMVPGQLEARTTATRERDGIPYPTPVWEKLTALASATSVDIS
jgi:LDH2 family malate/lactate/ureidoglycolate dehydrogenase